jgi:hypothetical protein
MGGYLASYNSAAEQRTVERVLAANNYWIGIDLLRNLTVHGSNWVLGDGSFIGDLTPSNADPYKHW